MNIEEKIKTLLANFLEEEFFLVGLEYRDKRPKTKLLVWVDGDQGISIDTCAEISRYLSDEIENQNLITSSFVLEVSSPGVDAPLKLLRQYTKNIGRKLKIITKDGKEEIGILTAIEPEAIIIEKKTRNKNPKPEEKQSYTIALTDIQEAKVMVSFN
ncbi:MAG: ribosome maturation factor RimP [Microscillaceae bacterium]|nr:ribosome maturation factor RimP [Microscillaceae bacterium]